MEGSTILILEVVGSTTILLEGSAILILEVGSAILVLGSITLVEVEDCRDRYY